MPAGHLISPAVLLLSEDACWLTAVGEEVVRSGGLVVAECSDAVSVLARAAVGLGDVVLVDPRVLDLDRDVVLRLRRRGLVVGGVGVPPAAGFPVPCFDAAADAVAWTSTRAARVGAVSAPLRPVVAVFGTRGAPGATSLAVALARRAGHGAALLDLDPRGGCIAEMLGVDGPNVLAAADSVAHDTPWAFTRSAKRLSVLTAPRRPWAAEVANVDIGLVIEAVARDRTTVIDAGAVGPDIDEIGAQILARATAVVLVGRTDLVGRGHLSRAIEVLRPEAANLTVVIPEVTMIETIAEALFSGAEEQHQSGRGVDQHQDRHRHSRGPLRLRLRRSRDR